MFRRAPLSVIGVAVIAIALIGCSSGPSSPSSDSGARSSSTDFPPTEIKWQSCRNGLQCGTVTVPKDYANPGAGSINLAVARRPAANPDERKGVVLFNPGGPGAPVIDDIEKLTLPPDVRDQFDLVGFDPRGIGDSGALPCATDTQTAFRNVDSTPDDDAERAQLESAAMAIANECASKAGDVLPFLGSDASARDVDEVRKALGEQQINFIGVSYGTMLGLRYLALFPKNARAMVLDSVVDPEEAFEAYLRDQSDAFEKGLTAMLAECPDGQDGCPTGGAAAAYDSIAQQVEAQPLTTSNGDAVGPSALAYAAIDAQFLESRHKTFFAALADAQNGDGTGLRKMADEYASGLAFGDYLAVLCTDSQHPVGATAFRAYANDVRRTAPRLGGAIANEMLPCAFWAAPVKSVAELVPAPDGPPTLVIGTDGDTATPYFWSQVVAQTLTHAHLLTVHGTDHGSVSTNQCVASELVTYLDELILPAPGADC
jgi:pimeloyl-ACP methyl ester carboxylesterase